MLDRLDERRAIAARIDEAKLLAANVNSVPEVQAARAAAEQARETAAAANSAFNEVWHKHYRRAEDIEESIIAEVEDLYVCGDADVSLWIVRCAVTGLPVFLGDRIIEHGDNAGGDYVCVLADAVQVVGVDPILKPSIAVERDEVEE